MATTAAAVASLLAAVGGWLLFSSIYGPVGGARSTRRSARERLDGAGLAGVPIRQIAVAVAGSALVGGVVCWLLFGGFLPPVAGGAFAATFPVAAYRRRLEERVEAAAEAWPRLLEEIRLRTGSLGRSVPQALFEAGGRAPAEWRSAFDAAEREWLLTTDFRLTVGRLRERLSDPTADVVAETLLLAYEIGGTDLDGRLADLIADRDLELQGRKDAASRLAGVRFARRFVLLVPLGMALAGLTIGSGRAAYGTVGGQLAVLLGLISVAACWWWSSRLMRMPSRPRVFR
ncbi:MAG TPA: hypothetical protein VG435_09845 [Acidimicrobiales bacterium]|jgi:tight adherence protein B|nr:hypothetical protein [Acidimicrobiales bacterium]